MPRYVHRRGRYHHSEHRVAFDAEGAWFFRRRRLFEVGLAHFAAASLVGGFSWEPWILVCARFIQGMGAAALVPASLSLLTAIFAEGQERNRAIGIYGVMAALGFVVGMVGGGVVTEYLGWRSLWGCQEA